MGSGLDGLTPGVPNGTIFIPHSRSTRRYLDLGLKDEKNIQYNRVARAGDALSFHERTPGSRDKVR